MKLLPVSAVFLASCTCSTFGLSIGPKTNQFASHRGSLSTPSSRRSFVTQVVTTTGVVASSSSIGWFLNVGNNDEHTPSCACASCSLKIGPPAAAAYERDVGGSNPSPDTAAFNIQARQTNSRLEAGGFKLDTKEEESARLSDAFTSFSYESISSVPKKVKDGSKRYEKKHRRRSQTDKQTNRSETNCLAEVYRTTLGKENKNRPSHRLQLCKGS